MSSFDLRERSRGLWAKSSPEGEGHSLLAHLLDVGLVTDVLLQATGTELISLASDELGLDSGDAKRLVVVMAALHDIGKATPVFQRKWAKGAPPEALAIRAEDLQHGRASGIILRGWLIARGCSRRVATSLANAVAIHHGSRLPTDFAAPGTFDPRSLGDDLDPWRTWQLALLEDVSAAFGNLPEIGTSRYLKGRTWALLAGLTSVADWLGSSLPQVGRVEDIDSYLELRKADAKARLQEIGWLSNRPWWRPETDTGSYEALFSAPGIEFRPRPLQTTVGKLVRDRDSPYLLIVEAPMGEGKTEAAYFSLLQPTGIRGGYIALPTQATSDAMHDRLTEFVARHRGRPVGIALAHGASRDIPRGLALAEEAVAEAAESNAQAASWFSQGRRELLAELGVGTVDQAVLSILPVRHFFVRLWGLAGKTVVLDEVHAYDAYTSGLIAELIRWLAATGTSVVLMSATLPAAASARMADAYCDGLGIDSPRLPMVAYPRATLISAAGPVIVNFAASREARVRLASAPYGIEELGALVLNAAKTGAAVVAIVNDVGRAQALYRHCVGNGTEAILLHARMPLDERRRRERAVVASYGPHGISGERSGIVVATQVVEQSLDLDFDVMFTDLAPVDLILQRAGRLHRHERVARPAGYASPWLGIAGLKSAGELVPDPRAMRTVYSEFVMWRTWGVLVQRGHLDLPDDIDSLVQTVYGSAPIALLSAFSQQVREAAGVWAATVQSFSAAAAQWSIADPRGSSTDSWGEGGRDDDDWKSYALRIPTRLGIDSVNVVPLSVAGAAVEVTGTEVKRARGGAKAADVKFVEAALARQVRVSRKDLVKKLRTQALPIWWARTAGLRHLLPLFLDGAGIAEIDASVTLDEELGLVYAKGVIP